MNVSHETPLLIVMVGLARSGKSIWAREQQYIPIASPDAIRLAMHGEAFIPLAEPLVWAIAGVMVRALFGAGHKIVIVDGCHVKHEQRQFWERMGINPGAHWRTLFKEIKTPELTCIDRCGDDDEMIGVVQRMGSEYEPLQEDELRLPSTVKEYVEGAWPGAKLLRSE